MRSVCSCKYEMGKTIEEYCQREINNKKNMKTAFSPTDKKYEHYIAIEDAGITTLMRVINHISAITK